MSRQYQVPSRRFQSFHGEKVLTDTIYLPIKRSFDPRNVKNEAHPPWAVN
jgi:hypothetical protein